jgi:hypothetical protein
MSIAATNTARNSARVCFQKSVTPEELRRSHQARQAQLSTLSHLLTVLLSTDSPKQAGFATEWMFCCIFYFGALNP